MVTHGDRGGKTGVRGEQHRKRDFGPLLVEAGRLAREEGLHIADLEEMDEINEMRVVAEMISQEQYVVHSATETP